MNHTPAPNGDVVENVSDEMLPQSELGTKEYWDALYDRELGNYNEDPEDEGTIWFDESNAEHVVRKQLHKLRQKGLLRGCPADQITSDALPSRLLDLGTGNGHMLFSLLEDDSECEDDDHHPSDWRGNEMVGVDYSPSSIQLARQIASQHDRGLLQFEVWDLLNDPPDPSWLKGGFDIVLDKGTFDAISLMPAPPEVEHPCHTYRSKALPLIRPGGFLMITSCNWTKDELLSWFDPEADGGRGFTFFDEAAYPTFTFGGRKGQSVVTVIFRQCGGTSTEGT